MNYEFHVGDYVETYSGAVGYIISVEDDAFTWVNHTPIRDGDDVYFNVEQRNFYSSVKDVFLRIGAYDFTKKEKKKIEQLEKDLPIEMKVGDKVAVMKQYFDGNYNTIIYSTKMIDKINEIVDAVNKLMDKEDKNDQTAMWYLWQRDYQ